MSVGLNRLQRGGDPGRGEWAVGKGSVYQGSTQVPGDREHGAESGQIGQPSRLRLVKPPKEM